MMTSIGGTRRNTVAGGEGSLRDHLGSMFTGHVLPRCPTITFPQSSIIYADSLQQAHRILKDQGYFVVSSEEVELFKASANQEINFKSATKGLTPAFSELRFKREEGKKTFFAKDYKKLRIKIGERGETTDWILMKQAKRCSTNFIINNNKALGGPVTTNSLHGQNSNHEKEKAVDGWRRERKKLKQALKNSPAYIRGSLYTPAKKKEKKEKSAQKRERRRDDCEGIKPASAVKHKQVLKRNTRKTGRGKGGDDSWTGLPLRLRGGGTTVDVDTDLHSEGTENIDRSQVKRRRLSSQTVNPLYDLERALRESRETAATSTIQGNMVQEGIQKWARLGIRCKAHTTFIPPDGDCLWSCFARYIF